MKTIAKILEAFLAIIGVFQSICVGYSLWTYKNNPKEGRQNLISTYDYYVDYFGKGS